MRKPLNKKHNFVNIFFLKASDIDALFSLEKEGIDMSFLKPKGIVKPVKPTKLRTIDQ